MSEFREGVYFNMEEDAYHAVPALSASTLSDLKQSPYDWWVRSSLNPRRAEVMEEEGPSSEALTLGKAFHKRILEGRAAFDANYAEKLEPGAESLVTQADLSGWLSERKLAKSGSKSEQIARIEQHCETSGEIMPQIFERESAEYQMLHDGKTFLTEKWMGKVELAAAMIEKHPQLKDAFTGGAPEVSVFWTCPKIGVPCKARLDYLKSKAIVSLKTMKPMRGVPVTRAVAIEFRKRGYARDAAFHAEAASHVARFLKAGQYDAPAFWGEKELAFRDGLMSDNPKTTLMVFQVKGPAPVAIGREFPPKSKLWEPARAEIESLKQTFRECLDTFGPDTPWLDVSGIEPFVDEEIENWSFQ